MTTAPTVRHGDVPPVSEPRDPENERPTPRLCVGKTFHVPGATPSGDGGVEIYMIPRLLGTIR